MTGWCHTTCFPHRWKHLCYENPDTFFEWRFDELPSSHQPAPMHILVLRPSIEGFQSCCSVISTENSHLYGKYKGKISVAVGVDATYCSILVEGENNDSWGWFLAYIRSRVMHCPYLCELDWYKGTIATMSKEDLGWGPEHSHYCFCVSHLASYFHSRFHDKFLKMLLISAAYDSSIEWNDCKG